MDIPNLTVQNTPIPPKNPINITIVFIVAIIALTGGFWLSRFIPTKPATTTVNQPGTAQNSNVVPPDEVKSAEDIKVGQVYGDSRHNFKDSATGVLQKGGINNEGTHTLVREGGKTQWASLTSSILDLDLFADRKVEVTGETNTSNKAGWLMDVGTIKVLE